MSKEIESHLSFIDLLIENGILFIEDNLVYTFKLSNGLPATYFLRTQQLMIDGKPVKTTIDDLIKLIA